MKKISTAIVLAGLLAVGAGAGTASAAAPTAAWRLQRVEDQLEIQRLLTDYGRYLDARDWRAYSNLFAEKGQWVGGFGVATGPEEIYQTMMKNIGTTRGANFHVLSNFVIDFTGPDTAVAWSRWNFVSSSKDNKPVLIYGGHYDDKLVREHGHWKFMHREAPVDVPTDMHIGAAAAPAPAADK